MDCVIVGEYCAQIPDRDGNFSAAGPSGENIVISLLGARSNHNLGDVRSRLQAVGRLLLRLVCSAERRSSRQ